MAAACPDTLQCCIEVVHPEEQINRGGVHLAPERDPRRPPVRSRLERPAEDSLVEPLRPLQVRHADGHVAELAVPRLLPVCGHGRWRRRDDPPLSERIDHDAGPPVRLVRHRPLQLGPSRDREADRSVRVRHQDEDGRAGRLRARVAVLAQHQRRVADLQLRVPDLAVRIDDEVAAPARREDLLVPVERPRGIHHRDVRRERPVAARHGQVLGCDRLDRVAEVAREDLRSAVVDDLVERGHDAAAHQLLDDVAGPDTETPGQVLHRDGRRQYHLAVPGELGGIGADGGAELVVGGLDRGRRQRARGRRRGHSSCRAAQRLDDAPAQVARERRVWIDGDDGLAQPVQRVRHRGPPPRRTRGGMQIAP